MILTIIKKIQATSSFKKYLSNTSWLVGEKIFRIGITAVVGIFLVRHLQPEGFGKLSYAISFVTLFNTFSTLGLDNIIIKNLVHDPAGKDTYLGTSFMLKLAGGIIASIITILLIFITNVDPSIRILTTIISFSLIFQSFNVIDYFFQSQVISKYVVYSQLFAVVITSVIKLALILIEAPLFYFGMVYTLEAAFVALGLVVMLRRQHHSIRKWKFKKQIAKDFITLSLPLIISGAMVSLYMRIDQIMIQNMLGDTQTGLYSAAINLSEAWYFIPVVVVGSFYPALVAAKRNQELFERRTKQLYLLLLAIAAPMVIVVSLFSNQIINLLYGETYLPAAQVLTIHIWSALFVFVGVASSRWLVIENLQKYSTILTTGGAIINIVLNLFLLPRYGIVGASWATLVAYAFSGCLGYVLFKETRKCFSLQIQSLFLLSSKK